MDLRGPLKRQCRHCMKFISRRKIIYKSVFCNRFCFGSWIHLQVPKRFCVICKTRIYRKRSTTCSIRCRGLSIRGKRNPSWKHGLSKQRYPNEFHRIKNLIRQRDNYQCQECHVSSKEIRLHVHHIDYNKFNNDPSNLITLCITCNLKANYGREEWTKYYQKLMWRKIQWLQQSNLSLIN